jgi:hypothetical protein
MASTRKCRYERNETTGKCNPKPKTKKDCKYGRNATTGKCNPKGRDCKNGRNATTGKCNKKIEILPLVKGKMERQAKHHEDFPDYDTYFKKSQKKVEEYLKKHKNKYKFGDIFHLNDGWGDDDFQIVLEKGEYTSCSFDGTDSILYPIELKNEIEIRHNKGFERVKYDTILKELEKNELWNPFISKYKNTSSSDKESKGSKESKLDYYGELNTYEEIVEIYRNNGLLSEDSSK